MDKYNMKYSINAKVNKKLLSNVDSTVIEFQELNIS